MNKVIIGIFIALASVSSQASYLWWSVTGDETGMGNVTAYIDKLELSSEQVAARVVSVYTDGETEDKQYGTTTGFAGEWYTAPQVSVNLDSLGSGSEYSYYIEIVKASDNSVIGYSEKIAYSKLPEGSFSDKLEDVPEVTAVWHGTNYKATPEPTSAMLMLIGVAGLALRRKQRKA